jgi:hypothetical protein
VSQSSGSGIAIFPNPATDHINVSFGVGGRTGKPGYGWAGRSCQHPADECDRAGIAAEERDQPAGQTITLPVAGYPAGSYLVQVLAAGEVKQSGIVLIIK